MGKGVITGGGEDGLYSVKVEYAKGRLDSRLEQFNQMITRTQELIDAVDVEIDVVLDDIDSILSEMADIQEPLINYRIDADNFRNTIEDLKTEIEDRQKDLERTINYKTNSERTLDNLNSSLDEILQQISAEEAKENPDLELITQLEETRDNIQSSIEQTEAVIDNYTTQIEGYGNDISIKSSILSGAEGSLNELNAQVDEIVKQIDMKESDLQKIRRQYQGLDIKRKHYQAQKLSYEKRKENLNSVELEKNISCWCADLTEDLESAAIRLIEVPGESRYFNIYPAYDKNEAEYNQERDGQLMPTQLMTPAQAFYNLAMLPGWQKWKPMYRYAEISDINYTLNTASITIDDMKSSQQSLNINQKCEFTDVPIEYMTCDSMAYENGNSVLVEFKNKHFDEPVIIGFRSNPKPCSYNPIMLIKFVCPNEETGGYEKSAFIHLEKKEIFDKIYDPRNPDELLPQPFDSDNDELSIGAILAVNPKLKRTGTYPATKNFMTMVDDWNRTPQIYSDPNTYYEQMEPFYPIIDPNRTYTVDERGWVLRMVEVYPESYTVNGHAGKIKWNLAYNDGIPAKQYNFYTNHFTDPYFFLTIPSYESIITNSDPLHPEYDVTHSATIVLKNRGYITGDETFFTAPFRGIIGRDRAISSSFLGVHAVPSNEKYGQAGLEHVLSLAYTYKKGS